MTVNGVINHKPLPDVNAEKVPLTWSEALLS